MLSFEEIQATSERLFKKAGFTSPLRVNALILFVANLSRALCKWGQLVLLTHHFSPELVGVFLLGFTISTPIAMTLTFRLRSVAMTESDERFAVGHYISFQATMSLLSFIAIAGVAFASDVKEGGIPIVLLVALAKVFETASDTLYGPIQKREKMRYIGASIVLRSLIALVGMALLVVVTGSIFLATLFFAAVEAATFFFYDLRVLSKFASILPRWEKAKLLELLKYSTPLAVTFALLSVAQSVQNYVLFLYEGEGSLGLFGPLAYFSALVGLVIGALANAGFPKQVEYFDTNIPYFLALLKKMLLVAGAMSLCIIAFNFLVGEWFLGLVYGEIYAEKFPIFTLIIYNMAIGTVTSLLGYTLTATRGFWVFPAINSFALIVNIVASAILIKLYSLRGAAFSLIVVNILHLILYSAVLLVRVRRRRAELAEAKEFAN
ncbi:MAG: hypothetical protein Kow0090_16650 [Myxococcota bacterium]